MPAGASSGAGGPTCEPVAGAGVAGRGIGSLAGSIRSGAADGGGVIGVATVGGMLVIGAGVDSIIEGVDVTGVVGVGFDRGGIVVAGWLSGSP